MTSISPAISSARSPSSYGKEPPNLVSDEIAALGDIHTAVVRMRIASGRLAVITNSRRATHGYDQRIEAHGSEGILSANNVPESTLGHGDVHGFTGQKAMHFFPERCSATCRTEWDHFVDVLAGKVEPSPTGLDGARVLATADAACESVATGRRITLAAE